MLIANKNGRKIRAMTMDEPVDQCRGVVQCGLPGCEAYMAIVEPGTRRASGNVEDGTPTEQVAWFLEWHKCHAPSRRGDPPAVQVVGRHGHGPMRKERGT